MLGIISAPPAKTKSRKPLPKSGAVCAQWVRCGHPRCRCASGELHGPYHYLFWRERGRLRKRYVPLGDVERVRTSCDAQRQQARERRRRASKAWGQLRAARALILEVLRDG